MEIIKTNVGLSSRCTTQRCLPGDCKLGGTPRMENYSICAPGNLKTLLQILLLEKNPTGKLASWRNKEQIRSRVCPNPCFSEKQFAKRYCSNVSNFERRNMLAFLNGKQKRLPIMWGMDGILQPSAKMAISLQNTF